jgi:tRNA A-37 threonylcarbamoyl transferase component Bud32
MTTFNLTHFQMSTRERFVSIPDEFAIRYCPNAEFERIWQPFAEKLPYLICGFVFMIGFLGYFNFLDPLVYFLGHLFLVPLKPLLQTSTNATVVSFIDLIGKLSVWVYGAAGLYVASLSFSRAEMPSHIGLTQSGLIFSQLQKSEKRLFWVTQSIPWEQIRSISVVRPEGTKSVADYRIKIDGAGIGYNASIRYGDLLVPSERETFLQALKLAAPETAFGNSSADEIFSVFKAAKSTEGFTELWLNELAAPSKREKLTPLTPGMVLQNGEYTITRKLGTGGQGIVYLATRTNKTLNIVETVALKEFVMPVFPDARVRKSVAEKFQAEAQMLSRIDHPQIVKLYDVFVEDHRAYLVLERITGKTLKRLVDDSGALSEKDVIAYARQMCEILHYLHGQHPPVVHRDFTPDNLMLSDENRICLIEFRGKSTTASDIYSFGATLAFLLTGQEPEAISISHPRQLNVNVSASMDELVSSCTALDESKRLSLDQVSESDCLREKTVH